MRCARLTWLQSCLTWLSVCVCKHSARVPGALRNPAANTQEHQGRGMYQRLNYSSIEKHSWPHLNMAARYSNNRGNVELRGQYLALRAATVPPQLGFKQSAFTIHDLAV